MMLLEGFEYENAIAVQDLANNVLSGGNQYMFRWPESAKTGGHYWVVAQGNDLPSSKAVFGAFTFVDPLPVDECYYYKDPLSTGAIIGTVFGGLAYLCIIALLLWRLYVYYRRKKQLKDVPSDNTILEPSECNDDDKKSLQHSSPSLSPPVPPKSPVLNSPTPSTLPPPFSPGSPAFAFNPHMHPPEMHHPYPHDQKSYYQYIMVQPPFAQMPAAVEASAPPKAAVFPYFFNAMPPIFFNGQISAPTENPNLAKTEDEDIGREMQKPHALS
ncbi:hypothetical protein DFQ30_002467 [Apophysomyces sp. BC1015]|nr:hypothetical protein DFQ30_002467 [Apophysomyces sp. BC1015]